MMERRLSALVLSLAMALTLPLEISVFPAVVCALTLFAVTRLTTSTAHIANWHQVQLGHNYIILCYCFYSAHLNAVLSSIYLWN